MSGGDVAATARLEIRVDANVMACLESAAELLKVSRSDFVRTAAVERAVRVLCEHEAQTTVPAALFEDLLENLDRPAQPNAELASAAVRARHVVSRC